MQTYWQSAICSRDRSVARRRSARRIRSARRTRRSRPRTAGSTSAPPTKPTGSACSTCSKLPSFGRRSALSRQCRRAWRISPALVETLAPYFRRAHHGRMAGALRSRGRARRAGTRHCRDARRSTDPCARDARHRRPRPPRPGRNDRHAREILPHARNDRARRPHLGPAYPGGADRAELQRSRDRRACGERGGSAGLDGPPVTHPTASLGDPATAATVPPTKGRFRRWIERWRLSPGRSAGLVLRPQGC